MPNAQVQKAYAPRSELYRTIAAAGLLIMFTVSAMLRNAMWGNEVVLLLDAQQKSPRKGRVLYNLGNALANNGSYREALDYYLAARDMDPGRSENHNQIANIYFIFGRYDEAVSEWRSAVDLDAKNIEAVFNLAQALELSGRKNEALAYYQRFINAADTAYALQLEKARRALAGNDK
jgi:tetratricopeptide (TPR) repeat protein